MQLQSRLNRDLKPGLTEAGQGVAVTDGAPGPVRGILSERTGMKIEEDGDVPFCENGLGRLGAVHAVSRVDAGDDEIDARVRSDPL